ncbi:phosphohydrolase [Brevundimonas sp. 2R-24]|uniref:Phosphohydrolase n=1 Tax=Peiella sedimenti TaxID=3061083 RepID=A0ABT8SJ08_9CAUL|nr:phosphohydrolase [Caulobacteraceae bacterium XZ-24]
MISDAVRDALIARYREPHRVYHTLTHVRDCLAQLEACEDLAAHERALLDAALWFHDAVYVPARNDNEAESARLARSALTAEGVSAADIAEIERLILLTAGHSVRPEDRLGARLVSIDLSILGARPADYDAYAGAIRKEYAHVPDAAYRAGRAAVMRRFFEAAPLFPDPEWERRLGRQARANIRRELNQLSA